jgi:hypothetical protein
VVAYCVGVDDEFPADDQRSSRRARPQKLLGGLALASIALACGSTLYTNLAADRGDDILTSPKVTIITAQPAAPVSVAARRPAPAKPARPDFFIVPRFDTTLLDGSTAMPPVTFSPHRPVKLALHAFRPDPAPAPARIVQSVPLPTPRPAELAQIANLPSRALRDKIATASVSEGLFDRFFGKRDTDLTMAYAPTDGGVFNNGQSKSWGRGPTKDNLTPVYDIKARTV